MRVKGLEPPSREALDPKSSVSTNFTTPAQLKVNKYNQVLLIFFGEKRKEVMFCTFAHLPITL